MSRENSKKLSSFVALKKNTKHIILSQHEEFKKAEGAFKVKDEFGMENGTQPPIC